MACARPLLLPTHSDDIWSNAYGHGVRSVPCGCCLNCRVDRRNLWSDRAKYEYCKRLTASFVTLTYDDIRIVDIMRHDLVTDELVATLQYDHVKRFIDRLRHRIRYENDKKRKDDPDFHNILMQDDFSYIYVGEYGENGQVFDRPHFHILFFGLDFAACRKIITEEWKAGFVDVLPLLDGGINYVLKYMDKSPKGEQLKLQYTDHGLQPPKQSSSKSFGSDLFTKYVNLDECMANNWTYPVGRGLRRPMPAYYRKKYQSKETGDNKPNYYVTYNQISDRMKSYSLKDVDDATKRNAFKVRQAQLRERKLRQKILDNGVGVYDFLNDSSIYFSPNRDKIRRADVDTLRWLVNDYRNTLAYVDLALKSA